MNKNNSKYKLANIGKIIVRSIITAAYEEGEITEKDLESEDTLRNLLREFLLKSDTEDGKEAAEDELHIIIDHRDTILKDAKQYLADRKYDYAKIFFAMYFEHETNRLIIKLLKRRKFEDKTIMSVVQRSLDDKLTWILDILGETRPRQGFLKFLKPLSDDRNSFLHYKFKGKHANHDYNLTEGQIKEILTEVKYFKRFVSNKLYGNRKKIIESKIDSLIS